MHPDQPIDTPNGQVKIKDFEGGEVYSWHNGKLVVANASKSFQFSEENIFEVSLANGKKIMATDQHRFLTQRGWVELRDLSMSDAIVSLHNPETPSRLQTSLDTGQPMYGEGVPRLTETREDYQGNCSEYLRQYGQQLLSVTGNGQFFSQLPSDAPQRSFHALFRLDDLGLFGKDTLSSVSSHPSSCAFLPSLASLCCEDSETCSGGKISELPLVFSRFFLQFPLKNSLLLPFQKWLEPILYFLLRKSQARILQTRFCRLRRGVVESQSQVAPFGLNGDFTLSKVRLIRKADRLKYWDIQVPVTNNYLSNGTVNHNSGKSHFMAEMLVEEHVANPNLQSVCIREIQKSLKFSAKKLIEDKIRALGVAHLFDITLTEIRRKNGHGIIIFQGMMDHTADSIKSLEGFDRSWAEEAQSLSDRSLELLIPTIRKPGSQLWFSWNPEQADDPVERLFQSNPDSVLVHVNYDQNPWCPDEMFKLAEWQKKNDYERYAHIWLGEYNTKSEAQVFKNWRIDEFEPDASFGEPLYGADFGFANDPTCFVRCWIKGNTLYIDQDAGKPGLELDDTAQYINQNDPQAHKYTIRADSARPESISYLKRHGLPRITSVEKWPGSVEDGVEFIKTFDEIVIHTRCKDMQEEARLYSYKIDKQTGDILPKLEDDMNHRWDAVRYALAPLIRRKDFVFL